MKPGTRSLVGRRLTSTDTPNPRWTMTSARWRRLEPRSAQPMSPVRMKHRSRPTANTIFARCGVKVCAIKRVRTATDRSDPRTIVTQPSTQRQLTDAERIAILDRKIASLEALGHTLVNREPFCAIINVRWKIKKIGHTNCNFGYGIYIWRRTNTMGNLHSGPRGQQPSIPPR